MTESKILNGNIIIADLNKSEHIPYDLLLIADPSKEAIDKYIYNSEIYVAKYSDLLVGCYVLCSVDHETVEIKNIAVVENFQGKGIGKILLEDASRKAKSNGFKKIIIGTANSSIGQLYLYQKAGFRITEIIKDFFIINYTEAIVENEIQARDMIILMKEI